MNKYLPWFLFLTGLPTFAHPSSHSMKCHPVELESLQPSKSLLNKAPDNLTSTVLSNANFDVVLKAGKNKGAVYVDSETHTILHKHQHKNTLTGVRKFTDSDENLMHTHFYRLDQIHMDDRTHQFTARLSVTERTTRLNAKNNERGVIHYREFQCFTAGLR